MSLFVSYYLLSCPAGLYQQNQQITTQCLAEDKAEFLQKNENQYIV